MIQADMEVFNQAPMEPLFFLENDLLGDASFEDPVEHEFVDTSMDLAALEHSWVAEIAASPPPSPAVVNEDPLIDDGVMSDVDTLNDQGSPAQMTDMTAEPASEVCQVVLYFSRKPNFYRSQGTHDSNNILFKRVPSTPDSGNVIYFSMELDDSSWKEMQKWTSWRRTAE
jgi:hypothetical protein